MVEPPVVFMLPAAPDVLPPDVVVPPVVEPEVVPEVDIPPVPLVLMSPEPLVVPAVLPEVDMVPEPLVVLVVVLPEVDMSPVPLAEPEASPLPLMLLMSELVAEESLLMPDELLEPVPASSLVPLLWQAPSKAVLSTRAAKGVMIFFVNMELEGLVWLPIRTIPNAERMN